MVGCVFVCVLEMECYDTDRSMQLPCTDVDCPTHSLIINNAICCQLNTRREWL